jgi:DNA polymerase elongation subunit (family B)
MDKVKVLGEIKSFLEGYNSDLKYLVNVETNVDNNFAECIIHEPNQEPRIEHIKYENFMYMKDLSKFDRELYKGKDKEYINSQKIKHGITITKLKTGNEKRLVDGYCYKVTSSRSYNDILNYFTEGGTNPFEKEKDKNGNFVRNKKGDLVYPQRSLFYSVKTTEQFFISRQARLYKGFEEYKNVHRLTFDIETFGLRYQIARMFAIGVRDNRGFETILEVEKLNDDESEIKLIQKFFNLIIQLKPAIVSGFNSEMFDFEFILGRAKILKMDMSKIPTGFKEGIQLKRKPNTPVKYGNTPDKYTATEMWGISIIDIIHAVKRTAAVNSEIKANGLKYIAKFEKIAKPNRTYIKGEDNSIGKFYSDNKIFVIDENNNYLQIPEMYQEITKKLYNLQIEKVILSKEEHNIKKTNILKEAPDFVKWFRKEALPKKLTTFIEGKNLVKQYLLDDLWETEQVDELYNQSSFMLAKIVPTTYHRICTMGTAGIWNLLMTAWSYENNLAIPYPDKYERYSGGLARCYKSGFSKRIVKIDYAGLYPAIQLTEDVFPIFDITGAMKMMLLYLTTTRNIYKKLANSTELNSEEIELFKQIDPEMHHKFINKEFTPADIAMFKIKQLPIKILNNSQYGAFGSNVSFNWSDNICAARITCTARLHLRHAIYWFSKFNCIALLAVTDGINFQYPEKTNIRITDEGTIEGTIEGLIEEMWQYGGKTGINALIEKYNKEEMTDKNESVGKGNYMSVDNDGEALACFNLSRINYATLSLVKDKKTDEMKEKIKLTGNTIKSKIIPEYIEDFIDTGLNLILHGKGNEFLTYYNEYAKNLYHQRIPLKKIASKSKIKNSIDTYKKRGKDKNGREKGMQAHMELLIEKRNKIAEELFEKYKTTLGHGKSKENLSIDEKMKLVTNYMPSEPELDSVVYYVNTGTKKSEGNSRKIVVNKETGEERFCATLISTEDLQENPNMTGQYNVERYLDAFNKRVKVLLVGFEPETAKNFLSKIVTAKTKVNVDEPVVDELVKTKKVKTKTKTVKEIKFEQADSTLLNLELKNFDLNDFDESMYLEELEVNFWNKTGYDPRKIWNGFKMFDDNKIYYEIYDNALKYLNGLMTASNKSKIKSINDEHEKGDLILIKNGGEYNVGAFNGVFIEIIKENVVIPKGELELEFDKKEEEKAKKLKETELEQVEKNEEKKNLEILKNKRTKYFKRFKKRFKIAENITMEKFLKTDDVALDDLDLYIRQMEGIEEEEANEYLGFDIDSETF